MVTKFFCLLKRPDNIDSLFSDEIERLLIVERNSRTRQNNGSNNETAFCCFQTRKSRNRSVSSKRKEERSFLILLRAKLKKRTLTFPTEVDSIYQIKRTKNKQTKKNMEPMPKWTCQSCSFHRPKNKGKWHLICHQLYF